MPQVIDVIERVYSWTDCAFPEASGDSFIIKARTEWNELLADPDDPEEAADVILCLFAGWHRKGVDLLSVLNRKLDINENRTWELQSDGTYQHVKE
jgi:hypothetical protein